MILLNSQRNIHAVKLGYKMHPKVGGNSAPQSFTGLQNVSMEALGIFQVL